MSELLSPRWSGGASTVLMRTTGCPQGLFGWAAVTALCALTAAGWGCGSSPEGGGGAAPGDAGSPPMGRAASGRRVALVVGNNAYTGQSQLYNAVNDARAVASALGGEGVGFSVTTLEDATRAELTSALASFTGSLREDDVALFYFAGHGVQVDGVNYLLPVDHAGQTEEAVRLDALSAASVEEMLRPARVAMLVFDACRNNPYRGVRGGTGLAPMEARGTLIAYAAGAGEVAADAAAPGVANGLFTSKFVAALGEPGLTASALFMRVRQEVVSASNEEQWPAVYNDLLSDFVFRGAASAADAPPADGSPPVASDGLVSPVRAQQETVFWQSIEDSAAAADFEAYLELFPDGTFAPLARNRLAALREAVDVPEPVPAAVSPAASVEAALGLDREARRRIQRGLAASGFDPGPADGSFGVATRTAIRDWQASRGAMATGYLDGPAVAALGAPRADPASPRPRRPGDVFRDCAECPEMVVLAGGGLAMGRYEVTVREYRAFMSAPGRRGGDRWRDPGPQTDRHPVTQVSWNDAQEYVSWLSRRTGATYRLPTEAEWERAAAGLSDMVGNVWEWTSDCWEGDCGLRVLRGGSWGFDAEALRPGARSGGTTALRLYNLGFRVSRTLN